MKVQEPPMTVLAGYEAVASDLALPSMWRSSGTLRVLAACLGAIVLAIHFSDYGPLIPVLESDLHISPGQAGLLSSLLWAGLLVACLPAGWLSDRYGQRPVLLGALTMLLLGGVLLPIWPALPWLLFCRALIGLGAGASFVAGAGVAASVKSHPALVQGCYGGCVQVGSGLGLLATPWLSAHLGWQVAFWVWGAAAVPALLAWLLVSADSHSGSAVKGERIRATAAAGVRSPAVWALGITHMGTFGTSSVLAAWISVYLVRQYGISLSLAATFGALALISGAAIRPLGGMLLSRKLVGTSSLIRIGTCVTCLGVIILALPWRVPALAALGMTAVAIGSTLPFGAVFDSAARLRTVSKGVAQGLTSMIAWQSLLWCPPLVGVLLQTTGSFTLPLGVLVLLSLAAIGASFLIGQALSREKKRSYVELVRVEGL